MKAGRHDKNNAIKTDFALKSKIGTIQSQQKYKNWAAYDVYWGADKYIFIKYWENIINILWKDYSVPKADRINC